MTHFTPQQFSESQARKGRKSKGGGRPKGKITISSIEQTKPWEALGISRRTYYNHKKKGFL